MKFIIHSNIFKKISESLKPFIKRTYNEHLNKIWFKVQENKLEIMALNDNDDILIKNIEILNADKKEFIFGIEGEILNYIDNLLNEPSILFEIKENQLIVRNNQSRIENISIDANFDMRYFEGDDTSSSTLSIPCQPVLDVVNLINSIKDKNVVDTNKNCKLMFDDGLRILCGSSNWLIEQKIPLCECAYTTMNEEPIRPLQVWVRPIIFEIISHLSKIWENTNDNFILSFGQKVINKICTGNIELYLRFSISNLKTALETVIDRYLELTSNNIEIPVGEWLKAHDCMSFVDKNTPHGCLYINKENEYEGLKLAFSKNCQYWIKETESNENLTLLKWNIYLTTGLNKNVIKNEDNLELNLFKIQNETIALMYHKEGLTYIWGLLK